MADEKVMKQAKKVYDDFCSVLESNNWTFDRHDDDMVITFGVNGDDLPMNFLVVVNPTAQVVSMYSSMPYKFSADKRAEGAMAVAVANYGLVNGCFDYDVSDGEIRFRLVTSFRESLISPDVYGYMLAIAGGTVDRYNDQFFMISKGMLTVDQFIEKENERRNS